MNLCHLLGKVLPLDWLLVSAQSSVMVSRAPAVFHRELAVPVATSSICVLLLNHMLAIKTTLKNALALDLGCS